MNAHANSIEAFHGLTDLGDRQRAVLDCYTQAIPLTDRAVAEQLGRELYTIRPRVTELIDAGFLIEVGSMPDSITGRTVRLCARTALIQ
jgi:hypothetical protein